MTIPQFRAAALAAPMFALGLALSAGPLLAKSKVIVKVNGTEITEEQLKYAASEIGPELNNIPEANRRLVLVEYLIENQIMADAANKEKLAEAETFKLRLKHYNRRALRDAYFEKSIQNAVTDEEAKKLYDQQIGNTPKQEEMRARHILVKEEAEAKALVEELKKGGDFAELAKKKSTGPSASRGGDLGYFGKGQMVPAFEAAVLKLKKGEVSEPVKTRFGWHVIKLEDKRTRELPKFEAVKEQIKRSMLQSKAQEIIGELRKNAKIEIIDAEYKKQKEAAPRGSN